MRFCSITPSWWVSRIQWIFSACFSIAAALASSWQNVVFEVDALVRSGLSLCEEVQLEKSVFLVRACSFIFSKCNLCSSSGQLERPPFGPESIAFHHFTHVAGKFCSRVLPRFQREVQEINSAVWLFLKKLTQSSQVISHT